MSASGRFGLLRLASDRFPIASGIAAQIEPSSFGFLQIILIVVVLLARIASLPLYAKLLLRFPKHCHPARLGAFLKLLEVGVTPIIFLALQLPDVDVMIVIIATGVVFGAMQSPQDMISHMLIGWAIDEDAARRDFQRREGMFYACNGLTQHLSQVPSDCFRLLPIASDCFWLLLVASGCFWLLLAASGCFWLLLVDSD